MTITLHLQGAAMKSAHDVLEAAIKACEQRSLKDKYGKFRHDVDVEAQACADTIRALKATIPDLPLVQPGEVAVPIEQLRQVRDYMEAMISRFTKHDEYAIACARLDSMLSASKEAKP